jgi:para-nitrobenzyl esterase
MASTTAFAQSAPATDASGHYSTSITPIGTLLDDPAAKAILVKYIPDTATNPQIDAVRGLTLKATQQYAPDKVTDTALANIDADLGALPAKK